MRTTVDLDQRLLVEAKRRAAADRTTLSRLVENALRAALARREEHTPEPVSLPTFGGEGLLPGVDLDDSRDLADRMDGR